MRKNLIYRITVLKKLSPFAKGVRRYFFYKLASNAIIILLALLLPYLYGTYVEKTIVQGNLKYLVVVVVGYVLAQIVNMGCELFSNKCTYKLNNTVTVALRLKFLDKRFSQGFSDYNGMDSSNEKMLLDEAVYKLCDFSGTQSVDYLLKVIQTACLAVILLVLEWRLALIMMISIPVTMWLNDLNARRAKENNDQTWRNNRAWGDHIFGSIHSWREIRAMQMEGKCEETFDHYSRRYAGIFRIYTRFWVTRRYLLPKLKEEFLMQFLLIFIGGLLIMNQSITIAALLAFIQYYNQLANTFQTVVSTEADLKINSVQYDKVFEVLDQNTIGEQLPEWRPRNANISLRNVSFRYPAGEADVLHDFSLEIQQGERVGIVGESGSGKTTLLNLMVGALEPDRGEVTFGGENLKTHSLKPVHKKVGFVLQENLVFNATVKENLLYAKPDATEDELKRACERARFMEYVEKMPDGMNTAVGERGTRLSGGERQRLVLARAFLRDVDVFVFDEATSALDQRTENLIQEAIEEISRDKTIIVVSHRESSLSICDRRVYLSRPA